MKTSLSLSRYHTERSSNSFIRSRFSGQRSFFEFNFLPTVGKAWGLSKILDSC